MKVPARPGWASFFAVCLMGYVLFVVLGTHLDPNARPRWTIDRAVAIEAVRDFASEQGADVSPAPGWWSRWRGERAIGLTHDEGVARYLNSHPGAAERLVSRLVPDLQARAQILTPAGDLFEAWLDPEGRRVGLRMRFSDEPSASVASAPPATDSPGATNEERARELAWTSLMGRVGSSEAIQFQLEDVDEDRTLPGPPIYTFTWNGRCEELPELTIEAVSAVRGEVLIREQLSLERDDEGAGSRQVVGGIIFVVLVLFALAYATVRLVRRAREGEVSRSRGLVLGGVFLVLSALSPWLADSALSQSGVVSSILNNAFNVAFQALILAFVWIALEGDVREALPGKLTTLDTLLSGRLLSRDAAWSSLVGIALAGPALALEQTALLLPGTGTRTADELANAFSASSPLLAPYVRPGFLWIGVAIFIPLSALLRWNRSPKRALVQLTFVLPAFVLAFSLLDSDVDAADLASAVTAAVFILVPFLLRDLLAAIWTSYAVAALPRILYLYHQPSAALRADGWAAAAVAGLGLGALLVLLWRGRTYSEEEVRPVYARNLAERLELLAEKRLADEAYERLAPSTLPEVPGVTLAASSHRGRAGGSKFYDLLALPDDRLGIAMIDLEGHGAAAALRLALLKGLLRTYSLRKTSPLGVLEGLENCISAPEESAAVGFAGLYAVYDAPSRTLTFGRRGEVAQLWLRRLGGEVVPLTGGGASDAEVGLEPGDALIFVSGVSVFAGAHEADLERTLAGTERGNTAALRALVGRLTAAADAVRDRTLVVVATAPETSSAPRDLAT